MLELQFAPLVALAGGAVLGAAAGAKYLLTGRILGISGGIRGWLTGDWKSWRFAFNGGLLAGALLAAALLPGSHDVLPASFSPARAALGGLLVGAGASLGSGCTSGHGICGNARLSPRSFVYTLVFMAAGAATATLAGTAAALGVAAARPPLVWWPSDVAKTQAAALLGVAGVAIGALITAGRRARSEAARARLEVASEAAAGALFAAGLTYTGMVRPAKVAAFLSPLYAGWDPTLMFVMGGALAVATPAYQWVKRSAAAPKQPLAAACFQEPANKSIDAQLLLGGVLFGAGWGLSGMCPGPALVALVAAPSRQVAAYCGAMAAGMAFDAASRGDLCITPSRRKLA